MHRRKLFGAIPLGVGLMAQSGRAAPTGPIRISPFDYDGVRLGESRWRRQVEATREYYLNIPDDDILHGFRKAAGLPAPGKPLGGWCRENSSTVFGSGSAVWPGSTARPATRPCGTRPRA